MQPAFNPSPAISNDMTERTIQTLGVNGLQMQVAVQGSGPLVLLCHGFPEL
jgi:hypothetical protein